METLYQDAEVVAVAKPAGVAVIPGRGEAPETSLRSRFEAARNERLLVVHRLDRDTSGVVLFARTEAAHRRLSMAFEAHAVAKVYDAWTLGQPAPAAGRITLRLHPARKGKMRPALPDEVGALESATEYRTLGAVEAPGGAVAHVEVRPMSGRQHQIRVHLRAVGTPLLVDPLYGRCEAIDTGALGPGSPALGRLTLHARAITFVGAAGDERTVEAPLPEDLAALEAWLSSRIAPGR